MEEQEQQEQQNPQMSYGSTTAAVIGGVGTAGFAMGLFNNGYRLGRIGSIFGKQNIKMVEKMVNGEKVAGNIKMPFTDLITRPKIKGHSIGEHINKTMHGSYESKGGFGFNFEKEGFLGIKEGQGLGYNFSFNKTILDDIESGKIDKDLLKKNFQERFMKQNKKGEYVHKMFSSNMSKTEFNSLINDSLTDGGIATSSLEKNEVAHQMSSVERKMFKENMHEEIRYGNSMNKKINYNVKEVDEIFEKNLFSKKGEATIINKTVSSKIHQELEKKGFGFNEEDVDKMLYRVGNNSAIKFNETKAVSGVTNSIHSFAKKQGFQNSDKKIIEKIVKESVYETDGTVKKEAFEQVSKKLKKEGIRIGEKDLEKIAGKKAANYAEKFVVKKAAKYAALAPLAASGVGTVAAGVIGAAFVAYDIITIPKAIADISNAYADAKHEQQSNLASKNRNRNNEIAGTQESFNAASRAFSSMQQANFGLDNLIRNNNTASKFLSDSGWR